MARKNDTTTKWDSDSGLSRSTIISGIIAIVVIVGLFVLFNALPGSQPAPPADELTQGEQTEENKSTSSEDEPEQNNGSSNNTSNNQNDKGGVSSESVELPTEYTVVKGDNLWKISENHYGTGYGWTKIASKNSLSDPDVIFPGKKLAVPKVEIKTKKHTVAQGDNLWDLSEKYYGSGFDWQKIADANQEQIGELPSGQPLITPGQILDIP